MARAKLRSRKEVVERSAALSEALRQALAELSWDGRDEAIAETVWAGEGLGMLLWALELAQLPPYDRPFDAERLVATALELAQLPPYDRPFDAERLVATALDEALLRPEEEIERARETARLWHWRARTAALQADGFEELPQEWHSFDQLVGATAMRGFERGLLPRPLRGDFPAFGAVYRELTEEQQAEAHQIAWQRHRALNWLCGFGKSWDAVPTDT